jgi:sec-independent protein translocase protein TatA
MVMIQFPLGILDLGPSEMLVIGILAILLFGERLPEVARTWGKKVMDFKRNIQGIQDELRAAAFSATSTIDSAINSASDSTTSSTSGSNGSSNGSLRRKRSASGDDNSEDYEEATAPKFEPPKSEPPASTF